jgi:hypothetical protein
MDDPRTAVLAAAIERAFRAASGFRIIPIKVTFTAAETIEVEVGAPHGVIFVYAIGTDDDELVFRTKFDQVIRVPIPPEFEDLTP